MAFWFLTLLHYWAAIGAFILLLAFAAEASTALSNLEVEIKGEGVISDGAHSPNFITKAVTWFYGS